MKLLLVFLSALVLVAHGEDTPRIEEDSVYAVQSEEVAGYVAVAGQEADGVVTAAFDAETEPSVDVLQVPAEEDASVFENGVYVPIVARACNNAACANVCHRLGFIFGVCINAGTCWCHN